MDLEPQNGDRFDVLVLGRNCLDHLVVVDRFPTEDQKMPLIERQREGGGQGGTSAACIARLDGRVMLVGHVGDDAAGRFCLERLRAFGVPVQGVNVVSGASTPEAFVFVTNGSGWRTIVYEPSQLPRIEPDEHFWQRVGQARVLLLDPETTYLADTLRQARLGHPTIVYDCERPREHLETMMAIADYFVPSADYFLPEIGNRADQERLVAAMLTLKPHLKGHLIITAGALGAYYESAGVVWHVPTPQVAVVDTTGAGDNFHGALALSLSKGAALEEAVKFSVAVASLSCRELGGRRGLPGWEEAMALAAELVSQVVHS